MAKGKSAKRSAKNVVRNRQKKNKQPHGKNKQQKKRGLFAPAKNKTASKNISIESPSKARKSVAWLRKQIRNHRLSITKAVQYANCAANRAKAMLKRKNLSRKERKELKEVHSIYRRFVEKNKKSKS
ncbi:hypothetical protein [Archaeoglobus veneficus]|uniref:Uncharacterized protein n=2 Tax=root TaxID=1 RepID=F2KMG8_ARCVS|nr:hypothetical protein [Archaeoglobus veneficus]AEA46067.1 hypothetical protein Arcve_0023 [Archaeoglobus veneficus SNP6]